MENLIWIIVLIVALPIVDVIVLKQRISKLQEQLNEALKNQVNLKQQVLNFGDNVIKITEYVNTLLDNVKRVTDVVYKHIISNDGK